MRTLHYAKRAGTWLCLVAAAACGDSQGPSTTSLSVKLTDAPAPFQAAVVTIAQVYLQGTGGRTVLSDETKTVDLLQLQNATTDLVKDVEVPSGTYGQLRIVVTGGYVRLDDGTIFASSPDYAGLPPDAQVSGELQLPSYAQSGIKVNFAMEPLTITGAEKVLLVDFDASQSFGQEAGQSGRWVMTPVITGAELTTEPSATP